MPFCTKLYSNRKSNLFGFSPFFIFTKCDRLARSSNIGEKCRRPQYHLPIQSNGKFKSHFLTNFIIGTCEVHGPDSIANLETSQTLILVPSNPNPGYSYSSKSFWASALICTKPYMDNISLISYTPNFSQLDDCSSSKHCKLYHSMGCLFYFPSGNPPESRQRDLLLILEGNWESNKKKVRKVVLTDHWVLTVDNLPRVGLCYVWLWWEDTKTISNVKSRWYT